MNEAIVIVPGIYTPRFVMMPLARRFKRQGYTPIIVRHRYLLRTPEQNALSLYLRIQQVSNPVVHLVGHSLGGLVILHLLKLSQEKAMPKMSLQDDSVKANSLQDEPMQESMREMPVKRVVLLGTPVQGSAIARKIHAWPWARWVLGKSVVNGVLHGLPSTQYPSTQYHSEIGVIYGTARAGLAAMLFRDEACSDGVVRAAETQLNAATDRLSIPHSHAIMLFSKVAAEKTLQFIQTGQFLSDQRYSNQNTK